jgi:hypothetical protein
MDIINTLKNDPDQDVADATENSDVVLLQERKILTPKFTALEAESQERERHLGDRWNKEEEERKRKQEEEEENKFDFTSFLLESKKPIPRKSTKQGLKRINGVMQNASKNGTLASRQLKTQNSSGISDSNPAKRKNGITKR